VELVQPGVDVVNPVTRSAIDDEHYMRQGVKTAPVVNPREPVEVRLCVDLWQRGGVFLIFDVVVPRLGTQGLEMSGRGIARYGGGAEDYSDPDSNDAVAGLRA
jgi:hypothetical protein